MDSASPAQSEVLMQPASLPSRALCLASQRIALCVIAPPAVSFSTSEAPGRVFPEHLLIHLDVAAARIGRPQRCPHGPPAPRLPQASAKTHEEKEADYERARQRIFQPTGSSSSLGELTTGRASAGDLSAAADDTAAAAAAAAAPVGRSSVNGEPAAGSDPADEAEGAALGAGPGGSSGTWEGSDGAADSAAGGSGSGGGNHGGGGGGGGYLPSRQNHNHRDVPKPRHNQHNNQHSNHQQQRKVSRG